MAALSSATMPSPALPRAAGLAADVPPPHPPPEDRTDIDLDTRISLVEQRLVAREQRLWGQAQQLGERARQVIAPRALLLKLAGVALAGAGLVWGLRRGSRPAAAQGDTGRAAPHASGPAQLLLGLLPMAWPLVPERWRARVSPATAATVLGLAVPLVERLLARRGGGRAGSGGVARDVTRDAPPTVAHVDLLRYAGTWHEQARLPVPFEAACTGQARATYRPLGGRLAVHNECRSADGRLRAVDGVARVVPGSGGARLQLSFAPVWLQWLPFVWADLWILHVDDTAPDYRVAIAGHPSRKGLWLLSRTPQLPDDALQRLIGLANDLGYDTDRLVLARTPPTLH